MRKGWVVFGMVAIVFAGSSLCGCVWGGDAVAILAQVDEIRNPLEDYTLNVTLTSHKPGRADRISTFEVMVSGRDKTLVKTLTPPVDRNRLMLMLEKDLWIYLPDLSKPLRISLSERLTGEVANGDIARANFSGDYVPTLSGTETIDGKDYDVLDLAARMDDVTYARVVLWVAKENRYPFKASFYAASGRLLKTCRYENFRQFGGAMRPTRIVMIDALMKDQYSVLDSTDIVVGVIPEKYFTRDYLKKLSD